MARGYHRPLYVLPFDHRGSFETGMFGWKGADLRCVLLRHPSSEIYDGFKERTTREAAVAEVARRYREFVDVFEKARAK